MEGPSPFGIHLPMSHEKAGESNEWYTPKYIFDALDTKFDLDVASPEEGPRYVPCDKWLYELSLETEWKGFVWMNPPFGNEKTKWLWIEKFIDHRNGIALMPDRTSAEWWQYFAKHTDQIVFVSPKVKFEREDGSIGKSPSNGTCLFACGDKAVSILTAASNKLGITL